MSIKLSRKVTCLRYPRVEVWHFFHPPW